ncbi:MAG: alpha-glucosidase C-terminal domain-containing protein [Candidatus Pacebacteria bacterium]|nr:alpha-glucosidase C-terminal domain-containing protein [Candidatus Paceibacterota bacterium]
MDTPARTSPDFLAQSVIYQMFLRPFTPEGTLERATRLLPHLADTGVDFVYLCPIVEADDSPSLRYWSERQKISGFNNPRNPYRVKDYYKIDPEYGTDADFRAFVEQAHALDIRVMLDLVYGHCGPKCNLIEEHPDFIQRRPNGSIRYTSYHFPYINFESRAAREYFMGNMEYFVREFGVDGYRTDMERVVPIDFWEEARDRLERIRPDIVMLAESDRRECQLKAYNLNYGVKWGWILRHEIFELGESAAKLRDYVCGTELSSYPPGARFIRMMNNHDWANDHENPENSIGGEAVEAILAVIFAVDGVPFLYNGVEIADDHRHSIYSNRDFGGLAINWANALTRKGINRLQFVKQLVALRRSTPPLIYGNTVWLDHDQPDNIIAFAREYRDKRIVFAVNTRNRAIKVNIKEVTPKRFTTILERGVSCATSGKTMQLSLEPYGLLIGNCFRTTKGR